MMLETALAKNLPLVAKLGHFFLKARSEKSRPTSDEIRKIHDEIHLNFIRISSEFLQKFIIFTFLDLALRKKKRSDFEGLYFCRQEEFWSK